MRINSTPREMTPLLPPPVQTAAMHTSERARLLASQLVAQEQRLLTDIQARKSAISDAINQPDGDLAIALSYRGKKLPELLARVDGSTTMTHEQFLSKSLECIFGLTNAAPEDWLQVENHVPLAADDTLDIRTTYQKMLAEGQSLYETFNQADDGLKELHTQYARTSFEYRQLQSQVKSLHTNLATQLKRKEHENVATSIATSQTQCVQQQTCDLELTRLTGIIQSQSDLVKSMQAQILTYENKLALVEALLGYDIHRRVGDDIRIRMIKLALKKSIGQGLDSIYAMGQTRQALTQKAETITHDVDQYEHTTSRWDRFWQRRKLKSAIEEYSAAA